MGFHIYVTMGFPMIFQFVSAFLMAMFDDTGLANVELLKAVEGKKGLFV
jgi:hypothetical protein